MKKRIFSLIIAIILVVPCFTSNVLAASLPIEEFSVPFEAQDNDIIISSDHQSLVYKDITYVRFDASVTEWDIANTTTDNNCAYLSGVDYIDYDISEKDSIITANIYHSDDSYLRCSFIKETLLSEHNNMSASASKYVVNFDYPDYVKIPLTAAALSSEATSINNTAFYSLDEHSVNVYSQDESFYVQKGALVIFENEYYYVDYHQNRITKANKYYKDLQSVIGYKVTDTELIAKFDEQTGNNNDIIDLIFSGELFNVFGTLLLCIIFGLIPLAALVLFLILSIRAKTPIYKRLFLAIYITSAAELLLFTLSVILLIIFK